MSDEIEHDKPDAITRLRAENDRLKAELHTASDMNAVYEGRLQEKEAENERLSAALRESADELDAYFCAEYPGDHPYSKRKLAEAMASNPARAALEEGK